MSHKEREREREREREKRKKGRDATGRSLGLLLATAFVHLLLRGQRGLQGLVTGYPKTTTRPLWLCAQHNYPVSQKSSVLYAKQ